MPQAGEPARASTRVKAPDTAKKSALAELAAKKARADKARSRKRCARRPALLRALRELGSRRLRRARRAPRLAMPARQQAPPRGSRARLHRWDTALQLHSFTQMDTLLLLKCQRSLLQPLQSRVRWCMLDMQVCMLGPGERGRGRGQRGAPRGACMRGASRARLAHGSARACRASKWGCCQAALMRGSGAALIAVT